MLKLVTLLYYCKELYRLFQLSTPSPLSAPKSLDHCKHDEDLENVTVNSHKKRCENIYIAKLSQQTFKTFVYSHNNISSVCSAGILKRKVDLILKN